MGWDGCVRMGVLCLELASDGAELHHGDGDAVAAGGGSTGSQP